MELNFDELDLILYAIGYIMRRDEFFLPEDEFEISTLRNAEKKLEKMKQIRYNMGEGRYD